jgi:ketosteroid isomerase-like protein
MVGETRMPSRQTVDAFVAQVVLGDHVGAIRDWYHDDAWMQENQAAPRQGGRDGLMQQEAGVLARAESVETELLGGPLIDGDHVAVRWRFSFVFKDGRQMRMEEIAWQTWRGDKIAEETFFYDPSQRGG